jgi:hypothetical protein
MSVAYGSTKADRYLGKLTHVTGRINAAGGHSGFAARERLGSAAFVTLSKCRAPRFCRSSFGQLRSVSRAQSDLASAGERPFYLFSHER